MISNQILQSTIEGIKNRKTVEKYRAEIVVENLKSIYCD